MEKNFDSPLLVLLLGPPGSGKGTHAPMLSSGLQIPHISTGELFRKQMREKTKTGLLAQRYIDEGKLVPDSVVMEMVLGRLSEEDCKEGAILDGFPRTIVQAEALEETFRSTHRWIVLSLEVSDELLVNRICGRLLCQTCGRVFHRLYLPPKKESQCDSCGGSLYQRSDDQEALVRHRLQIYHMQTKPLIEHYHAMGGVLRIVDGSKDKSAVAAALAQACALESVV